MHAGEFDAAAVCSTLDAMKATASIEDDKTMITDRIKRECGMAAYNEQLRKYIEEQYRLVALSRRIQSNSQDRAGGRRRRTVGESSGSGRGAGQPQMSGGRRGDGEFEELLKHMRRMHMRLEAIEAQQKEMAAEQQAARRRADEQQAA